MVNRLSLFISPTYLSCPCFFTFQVRVEKVNQPEDYISALLDRVKKEHIQKTYGVVEWSDSEDFLEQIAKKSGRLLKVIVQC